MQTLLVVILAVLLIANVVMGYALWRVTDYNKALKFKANLKRKIAKMVKEKHV